MFLWLANLLGDNVIGLSALNYTTLRAVMACLTALAVSLCFGTRVIGKLAALKVGQVVRSDGPQSHLIKTGTPTMGGVLILLSIIISTLLWTDLNNHYITLLLFVLISSGLVGFYDDWQKIVCQNAQGLSVYSKIIWQSIIAIASGIFLFYTAQLPASYEFIVPFFKEISYPLGACGFFVLTYLVIVGTSNAVNLTDGLDGLAALPVVLVSAGLAVFAYVAGHIIFAKYLQLPFVPGAHEVVIFCSAICGACLGFLWFNVYPAQIFMGDVGALPLGAVLGVVAVVIRQEIVLLIMGGLFVMEAVSVLLQVTSFKLTGRRIFRMAPLHHHYELKGWTETQVVVRFWIITMMLVLIGLTTLKLR